MQKELSGHGVQSAKTMSGPASLQDIVTFTVLAALFAMFGDAIIAHAMLWGNDPYWTYWITDGF